MVSSISGVGSSSSMSMFQNVTELTDDQQSKLEEILENYDSETMTSEDVQSLFKELREAGIPPGDGLKESMEEAGFDLGEIRARNGEEEGTQPPPPPPQSSSSSGTKADISTLQTLQSILDQYDLSNLSEDEQDELYSKLSDAGLTNSSGNLIDLGV